MITYEVKPNRIKEKDQLWRPERDKWLRKTDKEEERYYNDVEGTGTNFTLEQLTKIETDGSGLPTTINYLYPTLNQKLAILIQTKPTFKAVGLDDRGKKYAYALDKALRSIMYRSEAVGEEEETIKTMLTRGMGISSITELTEHQFGTFSLRYEDLHPSMVILDINARKRSLNDMSGHFIEKEIELNEAKKRYQVIVDEINRKFRVGETPLTMESFTTPGTNVPQGQGRLQTSGYNNVVYAQEFYEKIYTTAYHIENPDTGDVETIFAEDLEEDQKFILDSAIDKENNLFIKKYLFFGDWQVLTQILPIKDWKIKVKFFEWAGRPYKCYGMIHFAIGMQEAYDKAIQSMLINGMLTNNAGWTSPVGMITDPLRENWAKMGAKPGVVKEYVPDPSQPNLKPERDQIQALSNFFPTIAEMMKNGIEYSTGINPMVQGNPQEAKIDVFSTLQQYQNAAMQRIQLAMVHINLANEQLGNVIIDYLVANLHVGENYAFFDENNDFNEIEVVQELAKDFKLGRYMVLSISSEAMPTQKLAMATELMKISQTTPDPMERSIYIQHAFDLSDMRGFDSLKDQIDTGKKLQGQVQQLQEELQRQQELNKQFENRALNAEYQNKLTQMLHGGAVAVETAKVGAVKDIENEKLQEQLRDAKNPVENSNS